MQTAFLEAVVNRQHTVLGRPLHALCLHDALALTAAQNPLWTGGTVGLEDLQQAVLICSLDHGRFLHATLAPQTAFEYFTRRLWKNQVRRRDFARHLALWETYVADYNSLPEYWDCEDGKSFKAPWLYSMAVFIEMHTNRRHEEILRAPIGEMFWLSATIAERLGIAAAELMTEDEIQIGQLQAASARNADNPVRES